MGAFDWVGDFAKSVIPKSVNKGTLPIREGLKDLGLRTVGDLTGVVGRVNPQQQSQNVDANGVARRPDVAAGQQGPNVDKVTQDFLKQFGPAGTPGQGQQRPGLVDALLAVPGQMARSILPQPGGALDRAVQGAKNSVIGVAIATSVAAGGGALAEGAEAVKTAASQPTAVVQSSDPAKGIYIERGAEGQPAVAVNAKAIEAEADKPSFLDRIRNFFSSEPDKAPVAAAAKPPESVKVEAAPVAGSQGVTSPKIEATVTPPSTVPSTPAVTTTVEAAKAFEKAADPATATKSPTAGLDQLINEASRTADPGRIQTLMNARAQIIKLEP